MEEDEKPAVSRPRELDVNFVDDDELQAALARSRRAKIHKSKTFAPETIASKRKLRDHVLTYCSIISNSRSGTL